MVSGLTSARDPNSLFWPLFIDSTRLSTNVTGSPILDFLDELTPVHVQHVCVLRLWPEQLGAEALVAVHSHNPRELPQLVVVVMKRVLSKHGQDPSVSLADGLERRS